MEIRPATLSEYIRIAELQSTTEQEPLSAAELLDERNHTAPGSIFRDMVAVEAGTIAGASRVVRFPWWSAGRWDVWVVVDPALRGRGIGTQLYEEAIAFATAGGATRIDSKVVDSDPAALQFARHRGFAVDRHLFKSALDLDAFDGSPFAGVVDSVQASGIRFFTMADAGDTQDARRRMYEVQKATALDVPGRERTYAEFEQYHRKTFEVPQYRPELHLLAADGDRWVGLAACLPIGTALLNRMTGVLAEYRGRQIALALKLLAIDVARQHGFPKMITNNDSENAPMLAINRKLGYRPDPGVYQIVRRQDIGPAEAKLPS